MSDKAVYLPAALQNGALLSQETEPWLRCPLTR